MASARTPRSLLARAAVLLSVAALFACASTSRTSVYYHPNADLSLYQRVAVLPLENYSVDRFAGERVREIILVELSALGLFEVVEIGEVNRAVRTAGLVALDALGPEEVKQLGEALGVQALMMGSVMEFKERRSGTVTAPEIGLSLRLVDVENGISAWSVADARTGLGVWTRLFGVGEQTQSDAARELLRDLFRTL